MGLAMPVKEGRAEEIVRHSAEILVKDGYASFNLRKVAASVGVRLGTVQYYYPTRESLILETLDRVFTSWDDQYREILEAPDVSPDERLLNLQRLAREHQISTSATQFQLELYALSQHDEKIKERIDRGYVVYRNRLSRILGEIRPDLAPESRIAFATLLAAQWEGLAFFSAPRDREPGNIALLSHVADEVLAGFLKSFRAFAAAEAAAVTPA